MSHQREEMILSNNKSIPRPFHPPKLTEEEWCDFRIDYETGMTLKDIAAKYFCDPRTVRRCILQNRSSESIGKQVAPTRLEPYIDHVAELYQQQIRDQETEKAISGICKISSFITKKLKEEGYQGGERTVRNYLRQKHPITVEKDFQKGQNHDQD